MNRVIRKQIDTYKDKQNANERTPSIRHIRFLIRKMNYFVADVLIQNMMWGIMYDGVWGVLSASLYEFHNAVHILRKCTYIVLRLTIATAGQMSMLM